MSSNSSNSTQVLSSPPASYRVGQTNDLLFHIFSFLPTNNLYPLLLSNKTFYSISSLFLYKTITIKSGIAERNNPFTPKTSREILGFKEYSKSASLELVKKIDIYVHRNFECPAIDRFSVLDNLPNLKILHIAGGERSDDHDEDDELYSYSIKRENCELSKCPFIHEFGSNIEKVIIRKIDFRPLKRMFKLNEISLKIRPCQIPDLKSTISKLNSPNSSSSSSSPSFEDNYLEEMKLPSAMNVERLNLVFWDEKHSFRIDWYTFRAHEHRCTRGPGTKFYEKDCILCPRETEKNPWLNTSSYEKEKNSQRLLGDIIRMMEILGNQTNLKKINIYNFGKTAQMAIEYSKVKSMTIEKLKEEMIKAFKKGREDKKTDLSHKLPHQVKRRFATPVKLPLYPPAQKELRPEDRSKDVQITFHTINEYYPSHLVNEEIDEAEKEYWETRLYPSDHLLQIRKDLEPMIDGRFTDLAKEDLEYYPEKDLETKLNRTLLVEHLCPPVLKRPSGNGARIGQVSVRR